MNSENKLIDKKLRKINEKIQFENLKSNYILKKIFENIKRDKTLNIIKYNKYLQKRLNIDIINYKEYLKFYSYIELELNLVDNKYGAFINLSDEEKEYYNIYFDNSKEEIKRNYLEENEKVKKIKIIIDYQVKSIKNFFKKSICICSIVFTKFYRINITDISTMFYRCLFLKEINFSNLITDNETNMSGLFMNVHH